MSGIGGDPSADLLATLRASSGKSSPAIATLPHRQSYSFSSEAPRASQLHENAVQSPPPASPYASHEKAIRHPSASHQATPDLLGLLKFGQPASSPQTTTLQQMSTPQRPDQGRTSTTSVHGRGVSASDLVSSMMGVKVSTPSPRERVLTPSSTSQHQHSLLKLLNQTASSSQSTPKNRSGSDVNRLPQETVQAPIEGHNMVASTPTPARNQSPVHHLGDKENTPIPYESRNVSKGAMDPGEPQVYPDSIEQQVLTSPLSKKARISPNGEAHKTKSKSPSPVPHRSASRTKLTPSGSTVFKTIAPSTPTTSRDDRSRVEALIGIGAPTRNTETVASALNKVGDQVDRQAESALAEAEKREDDIKQEQEENIDQVKLDTIDQHIHVAAVGLKEELEKEGNSDVLEATLPKPAADAVKEIIDEAAKPRDEAASVAAENESDDDPSVRRVKVYQFPMRPFVSIDLLQKDLPALSLREQADLPVARFKKEFDQADRTLGAATSEYIVYAMPKTNGGIRVIQQDNGNSSLIFPNTQDRVFNVAISTGVGGVNQGPQNVIATGVSGTVYWTTVSEANVQLSQEEMQARSIHFPPSPAGSDSTSGGQLKTRAKRSNRHPSLFAVGRGKSIQIVFPDHARNSEFVSKDSIIDTEQYFASRSLKIMTGKAGKDFAFSEDDSAIATLDKAGKLRLWDIRELIDEANATASRLASIEVKVPILTFATAFASEKSWPTSVMFVDKQRPYSKGSALRYIIVGMKQNHTLQLWDLCLGKAVQELNFSHEKETDPICSVVYHPTTGIIVVGHPTRNSIYFIHLSAPRYNLPTISQAQFAQRLANKDTTLPRADSTAIMSGMREYSLADKGQLRSVELTQSSAESTQSADGDEEPTLFELVIMHSKGVLCLGVKKEDLGWSRENKVLHPVSAEEKGFVTVKDLRDTSSNQASEPSTNGDVPATSSAPKGTPKSSSKETIKPDRSGSTTPSRELEKKKSKNTNIAESTSRSLVVSPAPESYASAAQKSISVKPKTLTSGPAESPRPALSKHTSRDAPEHVPAISGELPGRSSANTDSVSVGISGDFLNREIKKIEQGVSNEFSRILGKELDSLYKHIAEDKRIRDAAERANQEAILRLVSSTLGENVEQALSRIIHKSIQESVLPSIENATMATLDKQISATITQHMDKVLPTAVTQSVNESVSQTLQSPDLIRLIADQVLIAVTGHIERELMNSLNKTITPTFQNLALSISQKISGETERRVRDQLQQADQQRRNDSQKVDQLISLVSGLSDMVHTMAAAQSQFQAEILKLQQKTAQGSVQGSTKGIPGHSPTPSESASMHVSPEQEELEVVTVLMAEGRYEDATIAVGFQIKTRYWVC